ARRRRTAAASRRVRGRTRQAPRRLDAAEAAAGQGLRQALCRARAAGRPRRRFRLPGRALRARGAAGESLKKTALVRTALRHAAVAKALGTAEAVGHAEARRAWRKGSLVSAPPRAMSLFVIPAKAGIHRATSHGMWP